MSETPIGQMRIYELRMKLKELGLPSSGTKGDLITRLSQHLEEMKKVNESAKNEHMEEKVKPAKEEAAPDHAETKNNDATTTNLTAVDEMTPKTQNTESTVSIAKEQKTLVEPTVVDASPQAKPVPSTAPAVPPVNTSLSALEARCKRFGIPFDPSKVTARLNQAGKPNAEREIKMEERRKRFGMPSVEKEKEDKKSLPSTHRLRDCTAEERKVLEARMKRFGLM